MKKCLLFIIMALTAGAGYAGQRSKDLVLGVKAGVNICNYLVSDANVFDLNKKPRAGLVIGFVAEKRLNNWLGVETNVLMSMQGSSLFWDNAGPIENLKSSVYYINIPVTADFYIIKGLALKAGLQPGFKIGASFNGSSSLFDYDRDDSGAWFNRFDLSVPVGVSYDINIFRIEARYVLGLTNILRGAGQLVGRARNSVWSFTFGVKF